MKVRIVLILALFGEAASFALMLAKIEPFYSYFYIFAWWNYIVFLSCLNHLQGHNSLLFDRPREFPWVVFFSILLWLFFEAFNFRLNNWYYVNLPFDRLLRWSGYVLAYGTVLPGLFETEALLANLGLFSRLKGRSLNPSNPLLVRLLLLGVLMVLAPLLHPKFFFPLVWLALVALLDPLLYLSRRRQESFLWEAQQGRYSRVARLLVAGLVCGLLWEFWNFWAGSRWVYSIPFFGFLHVFEMPFLGFLGFPPFALESYLAYRLFELFRERFLRRSFALKALFLAAAAIYCVLILNGIDRLTVHTYRL